MKAFCVLLAVAVCLLEVNADWCSHSCTKTRRKSIRCGWYGWSRCTRYESYQGTCRSYCRNGGWSTFVESERSSCSATCGSGTQTRVLKRTCTNPTPYNHGAQCRGQSYKTEIVSCNERPCPINGGWSDWSDYEEYDECTALCGGGEVDEYRERSCTNPNPAYGGDECVGATIENRTIECNTQKCGDNCPKNQVKYFTHPEINARYYQCDNEVAKRKDCGDNTIWNQEKHTCIHENIPAAAPPAESICDGRITVADDQDCTKFYMCAFGSRTGQSIQCAPGLAYHSTYQTCVHRAQAPNC
ncbi:hypothetical protein LOTGIDRAFT_235672 [Lottia gigantea]|uniref:Chitin-binding type-2 domain-containing protein n=1 Tax=Lottia gigantea TaxID=225164 RepID=V3ZNJ0_LOTGI|nr:hypothetical protein LOTGIDRAFT_235672 [Lottia gigantea]ESO85867.1 hypothetical protein LOTGIDRAFT_235672 [Lottia gigantea]